MADLINFRFPPARPTLLNFQLLVFIFSFPLSDISFFRVEVDADFDEFPVVGGVGDEVAPVVNLGESLVGGAVEFELEDVDVVGGFHDGIGPSLGTSYFYLGELSHELEDEVEDGLVVAFRAVVQLVGNPGEEGPQAGKEGIDITRFQLVDELADIETRVGFGHGGVEGGDEVEEPVFHLVVGEP